MSLAAYLKLASADGPHWTEIHDLDDDLPTGDITEAIEHIDYFDYGEHAGFWSGKGGDDPEPGESRNGYNWHDIHDGYGGLNISRVEAFARHVLTMVENSPPDMGSAPADMQCLLGTTGGQWGVYGVGVLDPGALSASVVPRDESLGANRLELSLDPSWHDHDFRNLNSRQPWLYASEAQWTVDHLRAALGILGTTNGGVAVIAAPGALWASQRRRGLLARRGTRERRARERQARPSREIQRPIRQERGRVHHSRSRRPAPSTESGGRTGQRRRAHQIASRPVQDAWWDRHAVGPVPQWRGRRGSRVRRRHRCPGIGARRRCRTQVRGHPYRRHCNTARRGGWLRQVAGHAHNRLG